MSIIPKDKRVCSNCGSDETYIFRKRGWPEWRYDKEGNLLCLKCYQLKVYIPANREKVRAWQKKTNAKFNPRRILFKNKRFSVGKVVRKGECDICHRKGFTHIHHKEYDENDPLAHTMELCPKHHREESIKLGQFGGRYKKPKSQIT